VVVGVVAMAQQLRNDLRTLTRHQQRTLHHPS